MQAPQNSSSQKDRVNKANDNSLCLKLLIILETSPTFNLDNFLINSDNLI